MKTGVIIHGCNLSAENWRHIAWGDPPLSMGRIPQGLLMAFTMQAPVIVMGSGASSKRFRYPGSDRTGDELLESEFSLEYLKTQFGNLRNFQPWVDRVPATQDDDQWQQFESDMLARIVVDVHSQNTVEELERAGELFVERGIERVVSVSSPTHIVRVLRDANKLFLQEDRFASLMNNVHAVPCVTCYEGSTPSDVVVVEPPHRPDRQVLPTHRRIQRMLALQKLDAPDLTRLIHEFDELLQRYEELYFNGYQEPPVPTLSDQVGERD